MYNYIKFLGITENCDKKQLKKWFILLKWLYIKNKE